MSVSTVESWMLRFPSDRVRAERSEEFFELIGVTLHGADGSTGTGWSFTSDYGGGEAVKTLLDVLLLPRIPGRDPADARLIARELRHITNRLGTGIASLAIAAIDIALWDLHARRLGVSLARALGQVRSSVPAYGSGKASPTLSVDDLVALSAGYVADGFTALKLRVGREPDRDAERVEAVRRAVGDGVCIMIDANERLDLPTALWLGRRLADFDIHWFEEPLPTPDLAGLQRLRAALPIPIALGEHIFSRSGFLPYLAGAAADILQPDACLVGGLSEAMQVAELADAHGLALAPHFMTELHIHLAAALPRPCYLEYYPFMDDLLEERLEVRDGSVLVPSRPGHGVAFTRQAWERYRVA